MMTHSSKITDRFPTGSGTCAPVIKQYSCNHYPRSTASNGFRPLLCNRRGSHLGPHGGAHVKWNVKNPTAYRSHLVFKMAKTKGARPGANEAPKQKVEASKPECKVNGMAQEWDTVTVVRDRILEGGPIMDPKTVAKQVDIKMCSINHELLAPLCSRICEADKKLPSVDDLRDELVALLTKNKRQGEDLVVMVEDTAKHIKSLCGLVKLKCRRKEVSVATRTQNTFGGFSDTGVLF